MRREPGFRYRVVILLIGCVAGCGDVLGPESMTTATVSGRVHASGRPLTSGWVEFLPVEGTIGKLRSAKIGPDGSFRADGVAVGSVGLRIAGPPIGIPGALRQSYGIRRTIRSGGEPALDIDLQREAAALAVQRGR